MDGWGGAERARTRSGGFLGGITLFIFLKLCEIHMKRYLEERPKESLVRKLLILSIFFFFCRNFRGNSHFSVSVSIVCIKHAPFTYSNQTLIPFEVPPKNNFLSIKKVTFIESVPSLLGFLKEVFCFHPLKIKKAV